MAYNNNYRGNGNYRMNSGRSNYSGPYNQQSGGGYGNRNRSFNDRPRKHSGAKLKQDKNGNMCIVAWNYSRKDGMVSVFAAPYKGTDQHESKAGKQYANWMVKITSKSIDKHFPVLVNLQTMKFVINEGFGWVVNPNAPNGGYCGTFKKK